MKLSTRVRLIAAGLFFACFVIFCGNKTEDRNSIELAANFLAYGCLSYAAFFPSNEAKQ